MAQAVSRGPVSGTAHVSKKRKPFLVDLYSTALGKKYVMAITGLIGIGFVVTHLIGNLKVYLGLIEHNGERVYDIDVYGEFLRELLVPILPRTYALWLLRLVLIGALVLHLHAAYTLTIMNRRARPVGYQSKRDYVAADFASRTMRWTGIIVFFFVIFHLLDLTWGTANPDFVQGDVYRNLIASFERTPVALVYVVANLALAFHLYHGAWSLFQSLGVGGRGTRAATRRFAIGYAGLVALGNVSFPIAVLTGVIR